jgi:hypothetical protein
MGPGRGSVSQPFTPLLEFWRGEKIKIRKKKGAYQILLSKLKLF